MLYLYARTLLQQSAYLPFDPDTRGHLQVSKPGTPFIASLFCLVYHHTFHVELGSWLGL